jgi:hypothetical protein
MLSARMGVPVITAPLRASKVMAMHCSSISACGTHSSQITCATSTAAEHGA